MARRGGGEDPRVDGPAVIKRRDQPARIDDREFPKVRDHHRGPVPVGQVNLRERERARDKGVVRWIELALDPKRPDPVQVMLDGLAVHQPPGVKDHPLPQQLLRGQDIGGLAKILKPGQYGDRVSESLLTGEVADNESPGEPFKPLHIFPLSFTGPLDQLIICCWPNAFPRNTPRTKVTAAVASINPTVSTNSRQKQTTKKTP